MTNTKPEQELWRYLPLSRFIPLIANKKLYVPRTDALSDKNEGKWFDKMEKGNLEAGACYTRFKIDIFQKIQNMNESDFLRFIRSKKEFDLKYTLSVHPRISEWMDNKYDYEELRQFVIKLIEHYQADVNRFNESIKNSKNNMIKLKYQSLVSSWSIANEQNLAMWRAFGGTEDVIAITTTLQQLKELVFKNQSKIDVLNLKYDFQHVRYIKNINKMGEGAYLEMGGTLNDLKWAKHAPLVFKPNPYFYEQEFRVIFYSDLDKDVPDYLELDFETNQDIIHGGKNGLKSFINKIYLPPTTNKSNPLYSAMMDLAKLCQIRKECIHIDKIE